MPLDYWKSAKSMCTLPDFLDPFLFPIPIDFHVLRIIFSNSALTVEFEPGDKTGNGFYREKVLELARKLFVDYCHKHDADPVQLCEALWLLSDRQCQSLR